MRANASIALILVLLLGLSLASAPAGAQSLADRLADVTFPLIVITISPNLVVFEAERASISGETASDLRKCIDDTNCPDDNLAALSGGDSDGAVEADEVEEFERSLVLGLNLASGEVAELRGLVRDLIKVDDETPRTVKFITVDLDKAEGAVTSTIALQLSARIHVEYPDVPKAKTHKVEVARGESGLQLASRITIRGGSGWTIPQDSIEPVNLRAYHVDGTITGSQADLEGAEPMTFRLDPTPKSLPAWVWFLGIPLLLLLVAGAGTYYYFHTRKG